MKTEQIIILVVAFFLGMLLLNMVKNVCGCELKEGFVHDGDPDFDSLPSWVQDCLLSSRNNCLPGSRPMSDFCTLHDNPECMNGMTEDEFGMHRSGCNPPSDVSFENGGVRSTIMSILKDQLNCDVDGGGPSYVLASNDEIGFERAAGLSEDEAKEAACTYLQSITECEQEVGTIPDTYYKCMDGNQEAPDQCGDFAGYDCDLLGNSPCPDTGSCPVGGCPPPLPECSQGTWSCDSDCQYVYNKAVGEQDCTDPVNPPSDPCVGGMGACTCIHYREAGGTDECRSDCTEANVQDLKTQLCAAHGVQVGNIVAAAGEVQSLPTGGQCTAPLDGIVCQQDDIPPPECNPGQIQYLKTQLCTLASQLNQEVAPVGYVGSLTGGGECTVRGQSGGGGGIVCQQGDVPAGSNPCSPNPCGNNAPCAVNGDNHVCTCPSRGPYNFGPDCQSQGDYNLRVAGEGRTVLNDGNSLYFVESDGPATAAMISEIQQIYASPLELTDVQSFPSIGDSLTKKFGYYGDDGVCQPWTSSSDVDSLVRRGVTMCYTPIGRCPDPAR